MLISKKRHIQEVDKLKKEIMILEENLKISKKSEQEKKKQLKSLTNISKALNDRNTFLAIQLEDKEECIKELNETIVKLCEKYDIELDQSKFKIENLQNDISNLTKYANKQDKKIEKFKMNSILRLQQQANTSHKKRIRLKKQKRHDTELIKVLENLTN